MGLTAEGEFFPSLDCFVGEIFHMVVCDLEARVTGLCAQSSKVTGCCEEAAFFGDRRGCAYGRLGDEKYSNKAGQLPFFPTRSTQSFTLLSIQMTADSLAYQRQAGQGNLL